MLAYTKYSKHKEIIRKTLLIIGLLFILFLVRESWDEISKLIFQIDIVKFIFSIAVAIIGNIAMAVLFNRLLEKYGVKIDDYLAIKIYLVGQIAKYIPGKIWAIAYQMSHVSDINGARGIFFANIEIMLGSMFMTTVLSASLIVFLNSGLMAFILIIIGMIVFVFSYKINLVRIIVHNLPFGIKNADLFSNIEYNPTKIASGITFYLVFFLGYISSYLLMLDAVFNMSVEESFFYIALLSAAWVVGVFAFIVPAGMGVREVIFVTASSYIVPESSVEMLISIAVLTRFWQILQEITGASLLIFIARKT